MNEDLELYETYCKKIRRNTLIFIWIVVGSLFLANWINNDIFDKVIIGFIIVLGIVHYFMSNDKQYKDLDKEYMLTSNWWHNKSIGEKITMFRNKVN